MPQPATTKKAAAQAATKKAAKEARSIIGIGDSASDPFAGSERLDDSEMAYHRVVMAQVEAAKTVFNAWAAHLNAKYHLTPADTFNVDNGIITRVPAPVTE